MEMGGWAEGPGLMMAHKSCYMKLEVMSFFQLKYQKSLFHI